MSDKMPIHPDPLEVSYGPKSWTVAAQSELPATPGWSYPNWDVAKTEMELAAIAETHGHNEMIRRCVVSHLKAAIKAISPDSSNAAGEPRLPDHDSKND